MGRSSSSSSDDDRRRRRKEKKRRRDDSSSESDDRRRRRDRGRGDRDRRDRERRDRDRDRRSPPRRSPPRRHDRGENDIDHHGRARSPIQLTGTYRPKGRGSERDRDRERDRSRSPEQEEPKRKKSGWDVATEQVVSGANVGMPLQAPQMLNETRQARRVYVGNLPGSVPPQEVTDFFNDAMIKAGLNKWAGPPIVQAVHQSLEGGFVFLELRDVDETTALLMYDGVIFKDRQLKVRRPADYIPPPSAGPDPIANPNLYAAVMGTAKIQGAARPAPLPHTWKEAGVPPPPLPTAAAASGSHDQKSALLPGPAVAAAQVWCRPTWRTARTSCTSATCPTT